MVFNTVVIGRALAYSPPMRSLLPLLVLATLLAAPARADVGPPPTCAAGEHQEYHQGHRCVQVVPDVAPAPASAPTTPPEGGFANPPTGATPPPASSPAAKRGCACTVGGQAAGGGVLLAAIAGLVLAAVRRRARR